ncbi:MAG: S26 family signal peptidase [Candidatus Methanogaster sp.]|uniref:S26 family signal peptidase n=1 Tax=Candidatus Methanogaster sp. TaxID=3386292 RepID=A0AC61L4J0_9EURY|nr:MAG: S26 family signal peptidase [ANME-2 cluster archaeon]
MSERLDQIKEFYQSDSTLAGVLRDLISVAKILIVFMILSQIIFGTWAPMRAIESGSMEPHMKIGDIVFIQDLSRTSVITQEDGMTSGYETFGDYGNVILYRKYGSTAETPIIHRAMYYVEAGEPMWKGGPVATHAGYITKGDNKITNRQYDQYSLCTVPIREEWVIGVARYRIPYAGYVRLAFSKVIEILTGKSQDQNRHT